MCDFLDEFINDIYYKYDLDKNTILNKFMECLCDNAGEDFIIKNNLYIIVKYMYNYDLSKFTHAVIIWIMITYYGNLLHNNIGIIIEKSETQSYTSAPWIINPGDLVLNNNYEIC